MLLQALRSISASALAALLVSACGGGGGASEPSAAPARPGPSALEATITEMWSEQFPSLRMNGFRNGAERWEDLSVGYVSAKFKYILLGAHSNNTAHFTVRLAIANTVPGASVQLALVTHDTLSPIGKIYPAVNGYVGLSINLDSELPISVDKREPLDFRVLVGVDVNANQQLDLAGSEIAITSGWAFRVVSRQAYEAAADRANQQNFGLYLRPQPARAFHNAFRLGEELPPEYRFVPGRAAVSTLDALWREIRARYEDGSVYRAPEGANALPGEQFFESDELDQFSHRVGIDPPATGSSVGSVRTFTIFRDDATISNPLIRQISDSVTFKTRIVNRLLRSIGASETQGLPRQITKTLKVAERFMDGDPGLNLSFGTAYFDVSLTATLECAERGKVVASNVTITGQLWDLYDFDFGADASDPLLNAIGRPNRTAAILQAGFGTLGVGQQGSVFEVLIELPHITYPDSDFEQISFGDCTPSSDPEYTFVDIGVPVGGSWAQPTALNNSRQVVGYWHTAQGYYRPFLYSNGQITDLGTLGGSYAAATGINADGQVVGFSRLPGDATFQSGGNAVSHAFTYKNGVMSSLGTCGGSASVANGINAAGHIVGYCWDASDTEYQAFIYRDGTMRSIGTLASSAAFGLGFSMANAINDRGQIVGLSYVDGCPVCNRLTHAFLYSQVTMVDLTPYNQPGAVWVDYSVAIAISSDGKVVGYSRTDSGATYVQQAFLFANGQLRDLGLGNRSQAIGINASGDIIARKDDVSVLLTQGKVLDVNTIVKRFQPESRAANARAINDRGDIVGEAYLSNNAVRAFMLVRAP